VGGGGRYRQHRRGARLSAGIRPPGGRSGVRCHSRPGCFGLAANGPPRYPAQGRAAALPPADPAQHFTVGATRYSDPFFDLDETEDEEDARLRDVFPIGARKPVLYEYDLAESWVHEITREKVFEIDPAQSYPACVAFSGDQPVEYADEYDEGEYPDADQSAGREPFSLAAVNAALAELAAPSN
jgi:hypothetical protein